MMTLAHSLIALAALLPSSLAQTTASCPTSLTPTYAAPSVAAGFQAVLVAQNLTKPRGIKYHDGKLLVIESGVGVTAYTINGNGSCVSVGNRSVVIQDSTLNHGIELDDSGSNGTYLYASSTTSLYEWAYNSVTASNISAPQVLVTNMSGEDHTTRTLLLSKNTPGYMIVCRGSTSNLDYEASSLDSGHSQVKAFDIRRRELFPQDYLQSGTLLGWGLRNEVGVDEHPGTGNIYGVENSADQIVRNGKDIHQDNPGEELNFLGNLANASSYNSSSRNFGYPECFAAWTPSDIPDFNGTVGQQFVLNTINSTNNDSICESRNAPRLTFQAHMAPLDILFNPAGNAAWVTFHGSWDRSDPSGYKLSMIEFNATTGEPVQPSTSNSSLIDIMTNANNSNCPSGCFRPVGLTWDEQGRLFMTSDATGEIYAIIRSANGTQTAGTNGTGTTGIPSSTTSRTAASASSTGAAVASIGSMGALAVLFAAVAFML